MAEKASKKKKKSTSRIILCVLLAVLAVLIVLAVLVWTHKKPDPRSGQEPNFDFSFEETEEGDEEPADPNAPTMDENMAQESLEEPEDHQVSKDEGWSHYLLLGVDESGRRSDAMIVLSVNKEKQRVVLSSVPRDTYVYVQGKGFTKLAHAHSAGGADLTVQTFEDNFDIDIENYFTVDFDSLPKIVDLIGGVTLTLTDAEAEHMGKQYAAWGLSGGTQVLDGKEVLAYCRVRKIDSDYKRNERQYKALMAIYDKVKGLSYNEYAALAKTAYDSMHSDMMIGDMLVLLKDVMDIAGVSEIENVKLVDRDNSSTPSLKNESTGKWVSYVVVDDLEEVAIRWRESLGIENYTPSDRVRQISKQLDRIMGR